MSNFSLFFCLQCNLMVKTHAMVHKNCPLSPSCIITLTSSFFCRTNQVSQSWQIFHANQHTQTNLHVKVWISYCTVQKQAKSKTKIFSSQKPPPQNSNSSVSYRGGNVLSWWNMQEGESSRRDAIKFQPSGNDQPQFSTSSSSSLGGGGSSLYINVHHKHQQKLPRRWSSLCGGSPHFASPLSVQDFPPLAKQQFCAIL